MSDRELLEWAAKAAGIEGEWAEWDHAYGDYRELGLDYGGRTLWNPLTDDGDALRLAVNLFIQIYPGKDEVEIFHMEIGYVVEPTNGDVIDATRRAIVRAAAEIGRQMQEGGAA